jgi:hypothetical protein
MTRESAAGDYLVCIELSAAAFQDALAEASIVTVVSSAHVLLMPE